MASALPLTRSRSPKKIERSFPFGGMTSTVIEKGLEFKSSLKFIPSPFFDSKG
jgi:hypothetical protein